MEMEMEIEVMVGRWYEDRRWELILRALNYLLENYLLVIFMKHPE